MTNASGQTIDRFRSEAFRQMHRVAAFPMAQKRANDPVSMAGWEWGRVRADVYGDDGARS